MSHPEEYVKRMLQVLLYIEDHVDEEITLDELAKIACQSAFHFHRIFHVVIGETVSQYIRRLRLEKAAMRLRYTDQSITEIALDCNYETPSAFTRAFKQAIGQSPRDYRTLYKELHAMTKKIADLPNITPDAIKNFSELNLLFIRRTGKYTESASQAWVQMHAFIEEQQLDRTKLRYFGIAHDDPRVTSEDKLRYDACILAPSAVKPTKEVHMQQVKGGKYAVFTHNGSYSGLDSTFDNIFLKWLPESNEQFDESRPVFEEYFNLEYVKTDETKLVTKIYIPLS